ncbi:5-methylaminomethyl-2-thiouridylate-methyltransferase [Gonapodya prolifera JEL478]|uniref:tRNA-5-taurinomethyluridine 2-sulfurtransferase n=1 Tax=Gonapodya prolifera (strain JEL478) TaxID=1344416 RepID=A0A139ARM8_GONPJ|nr:5-methylaminomethyl-2-thiouridylate-methyltransferase [Gonapodya prolifera JEL478]|eukprot:KXS19314.1 5-methylaminomethyl-2-thiouridylate-methyltransferase [Gonapodya prolifera JEL478]
MSGGVDSSVAAFLLQSQGYDVHAVYMHNWEARDAGGRACTSEQDWQDVQAVCRHLGIASQNVQRVDFVKDYWTDVFEPTLQDYAAGRTPNPDIACNSYIKFGKLFDRFADQFDWIATGHYARIELDTDGNPRLLKAVDPSKDQTYFLHQVSPSILRQTLFPVGDLYKSRVKEIAAEIGLPTASKKESMGICFVGKRKQFGEFLEEYLEQKSGRFVTLDGSVKGEHRGLSYFTVGQCARLPGEAEKWYVAKKDMLTGDITVVNGWYHPALLARSAIVSSWNWIPQAPTTLSSSPLRAQAAHRYHESLSGCSVYSIPSTNDHLEVRYAIEFDVPQRAVAEGQWIVLYDGDVCLGGGTIVDVGPSVFQLEQSEKKRRSNMTHECPPYFIFK